jgi:hypothetical protein
MPRSLALRDCQLPQEQSKSVNGEPLEGGRPINKTAGPPSKAQMESRSPLIADFFNGIDPKPTSTANLLGSTITPPRCALLRDDLMQINAHQAF